MVDNKAAPLESEYLCDVHGTKTNKRNSLRRINALVVEDVKINQDIASAMLTMLGAEVTVANDGSEALGLIEQHHFDVIFMDCQMPEMDGFDAARSIRYRESVIAAEPVPIIALTAGGDKSEKIRAIEAGMNDYITKPFTLLEIKACIAQFFEFNEHTQSVDTVKRKTIAKANSGLSNLTTEPTDHLCEISHEVLDGILAVEEQTGKELLHQLLTGFIEQSHDKSNELTAAIQAQDRDSVRKAAHAIKSMSSSLGAESIRESFEEIERSYRTISFQELSKRNATLSILVNEFAANASDYRNSRCRFFRNG